MKEESIPFIQVYCPELKEMIRPGESPVCPFFGGKKLDISKTEDAVKQIFRCHVQCGCSIEYQYYEGGKLVKKVEDTIEDQDTLRRSLSFVTRESDKSKKSKQKKVLLVDDDSDFLEMHSAVLENKGYDVITAQSSKECMKKLEKVRPDIIVLDVMMEQFDSGFKACEKIKKKYRDLPVMILTSIGAQTGLDFSSSRNVLEVSGADILLDKPVNPKQFIDEIEKLTAKKKS